MYLCQIIVKVINDIKAINDMYITSIYWPNRHIPYNTNISLELFLIFYIFAGINFRVKARARN